MALLRWAGAEREAWLNAVTHDPLQSQTCFSLVAQEWQPALVERTR